MQTRLGGDEKEGEGVGVGEEGEVHLPPRSTQQGGFKCGKQPVAEQVQPLLLGGGASFLPHRIVSPPPGAIVSATLGPSEWEIQELHHPNRKGYRLSGLKQ